MLGINEASVRGVRRLFRNPDALYRDLLAVRVSPTDEDSYVFAAYNQQLQAHHEHRSRPHNAQMVGT